MSNNENLYWPNCDIHSSSAEYAKRFSGTVGEFFLSRQSEIINRIIKDSENFSVLDVGGGHGQILKQLSNFTKDITILGSDLRCSYLISNEIQNGICQFKVGNFYDLPFKDNSFDYVISLRQIAHVEDTKQFIHELCRVSKNFVVIDYAPLISFNLLAPLLFQIKKRIEKNTRTFLVHRNSEIRNLFKNSDFEILASYSQFFWPMGIHRLLKNKEKSIMLENFAGRLGLVKLFGSPTIIVARKSN